LGYVGLPLVKAFWKAGYPVLGFDVDTSKIERLKRGESYIRHIAGDDVAAMVKSGKFEVTADYAALSSADAILICVPTPLTRHQDPDLSYVMSSTEGLQPHLRAGQLVVLESTTFPGTTREFMKPILERGGLKLGEDVFLAYSPEREDPGNPQFSTADIPKVVGGDDPVSTELAQAVYEKITKVVPVSSADTAEAVKLTENIFRAVNIALVNELKLVFERMGIDIWEVIEAAKTKPFGYMPFYPGPGWGGHCIPIDPFYLTWKAREYGVMTRFIELAGQVNTSMPDHVVRRLAESMDTRLSKGLKGSKVLIVGAAYKKNVDDMRESPALRIMETLQARGADISYYDPFIAEIIATREHATLTGMRSIALTKDSLAKFDAALISTDHDNVDYEFIVTNSKLVVDTRNATRAVTQHRDRIVRA
ncbi:MAG: nucleotide sugar dehydrogenase, partial [Rhodobacteraceae bacterium]|nr:nucleotide sugar dehydrogenase [Paracoccaceae bacterium]